MDFPFRLPLLLDGATGTNLYERGLPAGECVEQWVAQNPSAILELQGAFVRAGSDVLYAPTFSANKEKLSHYGLREQVAELNAQLVALSKQAAADAKGKAVLIGGDMSPSGLFVEPFGETSFTELIAIYSEQAAALKAAGVDYFALETMMSLTDIRAAVIACRKQQLPIFVTITVDENGMTLTGATALSCLIVAQSMGVVAFGLNCSNGPEQMLEIIQQIAPYAQIPLIAKPNAGPPDPLVPGKHALSPEQMAEQCAPLLESGVQILGGCCGNTPAHVAKLRALVDGFDFSSVQVDKEDTSLVFANETQTFFLLPDAIEVSEPLECSVDMVDELLELSEGSLDVICVRVGTPDDAYQFSLNAHMAKLPVMFLSDNEIALKTALMLYQGRALVDCGSDMDDKVLQSIAAKYGAVVY